MTDYKEMPYSMRLTYQLLAVFLIGWFVYIGNPVLVPIYFSILLSILLLPVANLLERFLPKTIANLITIVLALIFIASVVYFLSSQISGFLKDIPTIKHNLTTHYYTLQSWVETKFHLTPEQQNLMITNAAENVKSSGGLYIGQTFLTVTESLFLVGLIAIYSFLILYYRHIISRFLFQVFNNKHKERLQEVISESKNIIQKYMVGLLIEMAVIAVVNSIVLLTIGVKYAIFLALFAALLNIIPYVGIFTGIVFTVLVTLSTSSNMHQIIWIIISMGIIHVVDANFLMPRIVGSKVKINALVTIIGVITGGTLIGITGIFLALPTIAILKIIFDRIDYMKPWGTLLGDDTQDVQTKRLALRLKKSKANLKNSPPLDAD